MSRVLGADDYPFVVIEHPIASATELELDKRAEHAAKECVNLLTA